MTGSIGVPPVNRIGVPPVRLCPRTYPANYTPRELRLGALVAAAFWVVSAALLAAMILWAT